VTGVEFWNIAQGGTDPLVTAAAGWTRTLAEGDHWSAVTSDQSIQVWNVATGKQSASIRRA
jgi:hypothetical protein